MTKQIQFGEKFDNLPDTSFIKTLVLINPVKNIKHLVENIPGKQASVRILYAIAQQNQNLIASTQAKTGLALFGDYVQFEEQTPNTHPNIRLLLETIAFNQEWRVQIV